MNRQTTARHGISLMEVAMGMMLLVILFSGTFRVLSFHNIGIHRTRQASVALYCLESARNQVLRLWENQGSVPTADAVQTLLQERFPEMTFSLTRLVTANREPGFRLELTFPSPPSGQNGRFFREVFRP